MASPSTKDILKLFLASGKVTIDSRQVPAQSLFFAIRGDRFDGNQFALEALEKGAAYAVVDDPRVAQQSDRCLLVENALRSLQDVATAYRHQFAIPVIGITGSNGKTTTKELVAAVLQKSFRTHFTAGNYNNHIGVPLTLLAMPRNTEMAVIEMGANAQGEIAVLSRIADPNFGLITNIGKAHLEGFGGVEGIKKGKSELYRHLAQNGGTAFINTSERFLEGLSEGVAHRIRYRLTDDLSQPGADYACLLSAEKPFLRIAFQDAQQQRHEVTTQLFGRYNVNNILTAMALGLYFGVPAEAISEALAGYQPGNNRSQIVRRGQATFLLDAYNANPNSLENAVRYLASVETGERKVAILGDMLELGDAAAAEHRHIAQLAKDLPIDAVILVGPLFKEAAQAFGFQHYPDIEHLRPWFQQQDWSGCRVLLKASRKLTLEKLLETTPTENA